MMTSECTHKSMLTWLLISRYIFPHSHIVIYSQIQTCLCPLRVTPSDLTLTSFHDVMMLLQLHKLLTEVGVNHWDSTKSLIMSSGDHFEFGPVRFLIHKIEVGIGEGEGRHWGLIDCLRTSQLSLCRG